MAIGTFRTTMGQIGMFPGTFRKEMDLENCNNVARGSFPEMVLETSFEEMNIQEKAPEIL